VDTLLVVPTHVDDGLRMLITDACDHARVRPVVWEGLEALAGHDPSLLLAILPHGQRQIPQEVAQLLARSFRDLPLVLLCQETLVSSSISLHNGRVTLLGQPLTVEKVGGRIRTALAGRPALRNTDSWSRDGSTGSEVRVRELRGREWWVGAMARNGARRDGEDAEKFPSICKLGRHGFVGLLPLGAEGVSSATLHQASEALVSALPSDRGLAAVSETVGAQVAGVWYSPANQRWSFYCPDPALDFWLISPFRLPELWRVGGAGKGDGAPGWRHLNAASGDLLLICSAGGEGREALAQDVKEGALVRAAEGGGPALLDHLESRVALDPAPFAALIADLR